MPKCVFCVKISNDDFLFRSPNHRVVAFQPLNPVVRGHLLFVHILHTPNAGADPDIYAQTSEFAAEFAGQQLSDYNLITSTGEAATQSIHHLHVHYIPRTEGDGLHLPWTNQTHDD